MTVVDGIHLLISAVGVLLMPFIFRVLRTAREARRAEHREAVVRLERIENGLHERLARLEEKVDDHMAWHISTHPR